MGFSSSAGPGNFSLSLLVFYGRGNGVTLGVWEGNDDLPQL